MVATMGARTVPTLALRIKYKNLHYIHAIKLLSLNLSDC